MSDCGSAPDLGRALRGNEGRLPPALKRERTARDRAGGRRRALSLFFISLSLPLLSPRTERLLQEGRGGPAPQAAVQGQGPGGHGEREKERGRRGEEGERPRLLLPTPPTQRPSFHAPHLPPFLSLPSQSDVHAAAGQKAAELSHLKVCMRERERETACEHREPSPPSIHHHSSHSLSIHPASPSSAPSWTTPPWRSWSSGSTTTEKHEGVRERERRGWWERGGRGESEEKRG